MSIAISSKNNLRENNLLITSYLKRKKKSSTLSALPSVLLLPLNDENEH